MYTYKIMDLTSVSHTNYAAFDVITRLQRNFTLKISGQTASVMTLFKKLERNFLPTRDYLFIQIPFKLLSQACETILLTFLLLYLVFNPL